MNPISKEILDEFLEYKIRYDAISPKTYSVYKENIRRFIEFIEENFDGCNLLEVTHEMAFAHKKTFDNLRYNSWFISYRSLIILYKWLLANKKTKTFLLPVIKSNQIRPDDLYVPNATAVFEIRSKSRGFDLVTATLFELLLTTGIRAGEANQLRLCDIKFGKTVYDNELQKMSPYIGGSINISKSSGIRIKSLPRTVYFSKLAGKLLTKYIKAIGIEDEDLPLFPYDRIDKLFFAAAKKTKDIKTIVKATARNSSTGHTRKPGFVDIDITKLSSNISPEYYNKLKKMQAQARKAEKEEISSYKEAIKLEVARKPSLHPHCLRHAFRGLMYYRNWWGVRNDMLSVRDLLGHTSISSTEDYSRHGAMCVNDIEWRKLMLGSGFEYMSVFKKIL